MSAQEKRGALTSRPSLYAYALRRHGAEPDGRLPRGGYPLPDEPPPAEEIPERSGVTHKELLRTVGDALSPLLGAPDTRWAAGEVHRRLGELRARNRTLRVVRAVVAQLPLDDETAARALGRRLTRAGTTAAAVGVGLGLLARLGEPEDVPYLRTLALLRGFAGTAVQALTALDAPTAALVWLTEYIEEGELRRLVDALAARDDNSAHAWLLTTPLPPGAVGPETARRIAEAVRLDEVVRADPVDLRVLAQAGRLLCRMASRRDYRPEVLAYAGAVAVHEALVARASALAPTLDHYAILLSLALDLHSGPSHLLPWPPGRREALLDGLESVLTAPSWAALTRGEPTPRADPAERRRAAWIRRTARQPFGPRDQRTGAPRLRIEVAVSDPADPDTVETRFLVDGRPLVPEAFGRGPGNAPEYLLDSGRLRATPEPREVQLAEAYCTEGCCGALHVTVRRDGDHVVWNHWRRPPASPHRQALSELPEYRFDAAAYDAEVARAESDHSWAWPARSTARLLAAGLRDRPELLTRWDCRFGWVGTAFSEPDTTTLSFTFWPGLAAGRRDTAGPWLQFVWDLPDDGTPPDVRAARVLKRMETTDPKTFAEVRGGSREHAQVLGFPWPEGQGC
ncbi:hypothetical protein [Streptomyces lateritius]|uniref:hypothetical protein n=1 Tax=Streptomyces lateritius TaxID=67313 RepID=UPI00199D24B5|nr:hypothetical protein [Streptomyces lateritius]GGT86694.1 hypothetical protein GCM10010272_34550 [Streptomyces lateritius]